MKMANEWVLVIMQWVLLIGGIICVFTKPSSTDTYLVGSIIIGTLGVYFGLNNDVVYEL